MSEIIITNRWKQSKIKTFVLDKKSSHIRVISSDPSVNPHCQSHGPAIQLCESLADGSLDQIFFACSANRDRSKCAILVDFRPNESALEELFEQRLVKNTRILAKIMSSSPSNRGFCGKCGSLVFADQFGIHQSHRAFKHNLSEQMLRCPTQFLPPLDNDGQEAQYFFSEQTLNCIGNIFQHLKIRYEFK